MRQIFTDLFFSDDNTAQPKIKICGHLSDLCHLCANNLHRVAKNKNPWSSREICVICVPLSIVHCPLSIPHRPLRELCRLLALFVQHIRECPLGQEIIEAEAHAAAAYLRAAVRLP